MKEGDGREETSDVEGGAEKPFGIPAPAPAPAGFRAFFEGAIDAMVVCL